MEEYATKFLLTARRATTGDILLQQDLAAVDLDFTWKLNIRLADHMKASSPFDLRLILGTQELDDTQMLRTYVRSGQLEVEVDLRPTRGITDRLDTHLCHP